MCNFPFITNAITFPFIGLKQTHLRATVWGNGSENPSLLNAQVGQFCARQSRHPSLSQDDRAVGKPFNVPTDHMNGRVPRSRRWSINPPGGERSLTADRSSPLAAQFARLARSHTHRALSFYLTFLFAFAGAIDPTG